MVRVKNPNAQMPCVSNNAYVANLGHDLTPKMLDYLNEQEFKEHGLVMGVYQRIVISWMILLCDH